MKKSIPIIIMIVGIILICYPFIVRKLSNFNQPINTYKKEIKDMNKKSKDDLITKYNKNTIKNEETIGYIEIDKINLQALIYEGSSDKILNKGVGHLENTGLPTNKESYNCVLARSYWTYF